MKWYVHEKGKCRAIQANYYCLGSGLVRGYRSKVVSKRKAKVQTSQRIREGLNYMQKSEGRKQDELHMRQKVAVYNVG